MPNAEGVAIAFVVGIVAGVYVGALLWRTQLEEARRRIEGLEALQTIREDVTRNVRAQGWFDRALLGDEDSLRWLGASGGVLTVFNQPAFTTAESRKHAADLYHEARRRLTAREPAP